MTTILLTGRLATGVGEGKHFTRLDWARAQFVAKLGIDPYPGTVNLVLEDGPGRAGWAAIRARPGIVVRPPDPQWCDGHCYRVRIAGRIDGAIVVPAIAGYPADQIEIIAAVAVREALGIADGDRVEIAAPLVSV